MHDCCMTWIARKAVPKASRMNQGFEYSIIRHPHHNALGENCLKFFADRIEISALQIEVHNLLILWFLLLNEIHGNIVVRSFSKSLAK